jgi:hypothetical protein
MAVCLKSTPSFERVIVLKDSTLDFSTVQTTHTLQTDFYEHSEQARAPHTNGPRDVPRCGALSSSFKDAAL